MMAAARAWLTAVVSVTLLLSVVQTLMPKGSLREITSFVGGLLLLAVLLRPLGSVDLSAVSLNLDAYRQTVEQRQAELEQEGQKELVGLIEAELESYISDKAADMGLTLRVQVTVEPDGRLRFTGGFPDADSVLSWVLTFGDKAELLEPEELRKQLRKLTETLADRYRRN